MKWIVAALTVLVLAAHASATTVQVKTGEKLTQITTDCWWVQKDAKNVVMRPLGKLRKHSKVLVVVDGQKMVCRVKDITRIS